ncbi:MAG: hypothetical protein HKN79_06350 [Flavobacteriales bacterium]|nr:hypothetical protein [Flavobacteriales bacterium]
MKALIYLISESRYTDPPEKDWNVEQILLEDELITKALASYDIQTERVDWADTSVDWSKADIALFRTPWDYFVRISEFKEWMERVEHQVRFINPLETIHWNFHKSYLQDLEEKGFPIVPSIFIDQGDSRSLTDIAESIPWNEFIIKPCISGGGFGTYRIGPHNLAEHIEDYNALIAERDMMVQEFHPSIQARGEVSHMVMGGTYTHSILKRAKGEDFRVQDDFGGTVHPYEAQEEEIALAEAVFNACDPMPVYGRLDVMWNESGEQMISELEIIEPELWFREHPPAAEVLAAHLNTLI